MSPTEPLIPFVDTHVHFWHRDHPTMRWDWLEPHVVSPRLGTMDLLKQLVRFGPDELTNEASGTGLSKVVHVQASSGHPDPVDETRWLDQLADQHGWPNAIIGRVQLDSPTLGADLEQHSRSCRFRGVRQTRLGSRLNERVIRRGLRQVNELGLVVQLDITLEDTDAVVALGRDLPDLALVIDHAAWPEQRTPEYLRMWTRSVRALSLLPNATIKISGLGMGNNLAGLPWTPASLRPWADICIQSFGTSRTLLGTNFPVDKMFSTYFDLVSAYRQLADEFGAPSQAALLHGNAERVYRI